MNNTIVDLQYLAIAYQAALRYDYCPNPDDDVVDDLRDSYSWTDNYTREGILAALSLHKGRRTDEIALEIVEKINNFHKKQE